MTKTLKTENLDADKIMPTNNGNFFEDMVVEILSKFPVKSLLRFRCVCKSWYELFESPSFISKHLKAGNSNTRLILRYVDSSDDPEYPRLRYCLFLDPTLANISLEEDLLLLMPIDDHLRGPFEGLFIMFIGGDEIALYNHATRDLKFLPKLTLIDNLESIYTIMFGLGLDPKCNYYKLVYIVTYHDSELGKVLNDSRQVFIYSFSDNSWRNFQGFEFGMYDLDEVLDCTYHNGACHWLVPFGAFHPLCCHYVILSFDMSDEVFEEILGPNCLLEISPKHTVFGLYNDSLSFLVFDERESCFDIWTMKERYHWTKEFSTTPILAVDAPIGFWKNDTFFIRSNTEELLLYDPNSEEIIDFQHKGCCFTIFFDKESLFTLKC